MENQNEQEKKQQEDTQKNDDLSKKVSDGVVKTAAELEKLKNVAQKDAKIVKEKLGKASQTVEENAKIAKKKTSIFVQAASSITKAIFGGIKSGIEEVKKDKNDENKEEKK